MRTRTTTILVLASAVLVGAASYGTAKWFQLSGYPGKLAAVAIGDSKEVVKRKMGKPDKVQSRPHWLWCDVETCESEFMYGTPVPPVWSVIGFDREGRVVWKAELNSP